MKFRLPIVPTIIVAAAIATMIALGIWQLRRLDEKQAMVARYTAAQAMTAVGDLPFQRKDVPGMLFRRVRADCLSVNGFQAISGRSAKGQAGIAHIARCTMRNDTASWPAGEEPITEAEINIGWSRSPVAPQWQGGAVEGWLAPSKNAAGFKLISAVPLAAGLQASAAPDPADIPNNHWSYAIQWFLFAGTALVIYAVALRQRLRRSTI